MGNQTGGNSCGAHHTNLDHGQYGGGSCEPLPINTEQNGGYSSFYEPAVVEEIYGGSRSSARRSTRRSARRSTRRSARRSNRRSARRSARSSARRSARSSARRSTRRSTRRSMRR